MSQWRFNHDVWDAVVFEVRFPMIHSLGRGRTISPGLRLGEFEVWLDTEASTCEMGETESLNGMAVHG